MRILIKKNYMRNFCLFILYFLGVISCALAGSDVLIGERRSYIQSHQELSEHLRLLILNGYIELGMSQEQIAVSIGPPIKRVIKRGKEFDEIWVYRPHWKFRNYLYFKDKILISTDPDYIVYSRLEGHGYRGFDIKQ